MPISTEAVLTLIAIITGPVLAVLAATFLDRRRQTRERQLQLFRMLMSTRRTRLSTDHVAALNLIEVEFHGVKKVIEPYKKLLDHLSKRHPLAPEEVERSDFSTEQNRQRTESYWKRIDNERIDLLANLLKEMSSHLRFNIDQLDIYRGGYNPEAMGQLELEQNIIRRLFVEIYYGRHAIPVRIQDDRENPTEE